MLAKYSKKGIDILCNFFPSVSAKIDSKVEFYSRFKVVNSFFNFSKAPYDIERQADGGRDFSPPVSQVACFSPRSSC